MEKIILPKYLSKKGSNAHQYIKTSFKNNQRLIPSEDFRDTINEVEVYNKERQNCDKHRLILTINPVCSNVLFNRVTEVIAQEGSDNCTCLNYRIDNLYNNGFKDADLKDKIDNELVGKTLASFIEDNSNFCSVKLTRDTQLSAEGFECNYKCGLDILNNHILRSNTFKCICDMPDGQINDDFNTIFDMMREFDGTQVEDYPTTGNTPMTKLHLYNKDDIMDFDVSVDNNISEDNGWLGFINKGKVTTYSNQEGKKGQPLPISHVINNKPTCGFVDFAPERDLWYFTPKFNSARNRFEKNWNYCLTYPSSSTTKNISFIRQKTNSLKVLYFDDNVKVGGVQCCKIVSYCKHGLMEGDFINLYVNGTKKREVNDELISLGAKLLTKAVPDSDVKEKLKEAVTARMNNHDDEIYTNLEVMRVDDDYTFYVRYSVSDWISTTKFITWSNSYGFNYQVSKEEAKYTWNTTGRNNVSMVDVDGKSYNFLVFVADNGMYKSNLSPYCNDVSFKQVIDNEEVNYYVRIFSKIPNWRFAETKINEFTTDKEREELITTYTAKEFDFESHVSKIAFSKNVYGDDVSQIVFTDDVQVKELRDNLGRPITDIFLTVVKNNAGYREWYGKNALLTTNPNKKIDIDTGSEKIEFSHVFGKVTCGFELSPLSILKDDHKNVVQINNVAGDIEYYKGLNIESILPEEVKRPEYIDTDEIEYNKADDYDGDVNYYGDLCYFARSRAAEVTIDDVWFRFNTAQRELTNIDGAFKYLGNVAYDNIIYDNYNPNGYSGATDTIIGGCQSQEGYRYKPHYKIPLKTVSRVLMTADGHVVEVDNIERVQENVFDRNEEEGTKWTITTKGESYNEKDDTFYIYNKLRNDYYVGKIIDVISPTIFICTVKNETTPNKTPNMNDAFESYKVIRKQSVIPDDAVLLHDGTLKFAWREIIQNGFDSLSDVETYPFTNDALYVEKRINFYVKRQDPDRLLSSQYIGEISDIEPKKEEVVNEDNYIGEEEISCF